jgi:hypothetical protein
MATVTGATYGVDFSGVALPFTVPDMLGTVISFLNMYGNWILLALGVIFAPVLYGLAMKLVAMERLQTRRDRIAKEHIEKYGGGDRKEWIKKNWQ